MVPMLGDRLTMTHVIIFQEVRGFILTIKQKSKNCLAVLCKTLFTQMLTMYLYRVYFVELD